MKEEYMRTALRRVKRAKKIDGVPVGCVIVKDGKIIARGHNLREIKQQSINHAEIITVQKACKKVGSRRLEDCDLYVTLEPCCVCTGAILQSRIGTVTYGTANPRGGNIESTLHMYEQPRYSHYPRVGSGVLQSEYSQLLRSFFKEKRLKEK